MELENITIASELTSSDPAKQINSLLILLRLYSAGKDVQHYVSTVIQSVLVKSTDTLVKKLCYQLIKGCSITSKYDWEFVMKAIVQDMTNSTNNELSIWAMRTLVSLCGIGQKLQEFFLKNTRQIEECVFRKDSERVRVSALNLLRVLVKSLRKSNLMNVKTSGFESTVSLFGQWVLRSIKDSNQEVACAGFEVLREVICGDCVCHFHQETLPLTVSKESIEWIRFMAKEYSYLLSRTKCLDVRRRYPALRPITYIALLLNQEMNNSEYGATNLVNIIKPMLHSVEVATVLETCHCILLIAVNRQSNHEITACVNHYIDEVVAAYLSLLERNETSVSYASIMKDVCAVLNTTRAKYNNCARLIENISKIVNDVDRMYVLTTIYSTIIKCSVNTIIRKSYIDTTLVSEMEKFSKENFIQYIFNTSNPIEQKIRCEILYAACQQFLSLQPDSTNEELYNAWIEIGIELCDLGKSCLVWNDCTGLNPCVGEFARVLTKMCNETFSKDMNDSEEKKRIQKILNQILDLILQIQTEFCELIAMCILSNFVHLHKQVSGKESGDVVFDHIRFMLSLYLKQGEMKSTKLETLLYCLLCVCMRSTLKLGDAYEYLKNIISDLPQKDENYDRIFIAYQKIGYALNYQVTHTSNNPDVTLLLGKVFHVDHPIFKSFTSEDDEKLVENYVKSLQMTQNVIANLHNSDIFHLKSTLMEPTIQDLKIQQRVGHRDVRSTTQIISHGSDPIAVTATYLLVPDTCTVYFHLKLTNISSVDMFQVSVEVGTTGGLELFEKVPQSSQNIGDLPYMNGTFEFEREYLIQDFDQSAFYVIVHGSHTRGSTGDMMSDMFAESGPHNALVTIRCRPLEISLNHMLHCPKPFTRNEFLALWEISHFGIHQTISIDKDQLPNIEQDALTEKLDKLMSNSTAALDVHDRSMPTWISSPAPCHSPQYHHTYITRTLFGDYLLVTFYGTFTETHITYDVEFRCTNTNVIDALKKSLKWFSNMVSRTEGIRFLREGEREKLNSVINDGGMDLRLNVSQMFGLNETKLKVLHLQKWHSIADARN
jgi:hypothetical protein